MSKGVGIFLGIAILVFAVAFLFVGFYNKDNKKETPVSQPKTEKVEETEITMKITSTAFDHNQRIPSKYTCDGDNVNPPFEFTDIPDGTKSLALIVDDPDAPAKTWVHWVVYNINSDATEVEEDSVPEGGIEGMTDFGKPGYGGPCPPSGTHRYFFKLYALDTVLELPQNATKDMVEEKMQGHIIDQAELIGLYSEIARRSS